jgi:hypothetical protein
VKLLRFRMKQEPIRMKPLRDAMRRDSDRWELRTGRQGFMRGGRGFIQIGRRFCLEWHAPAKKSYVACRSLACRTTRSSISYSPITWHDNRVDYFLAHMDQLAAAHGVGAAFGAGRGDQTTPDDDGGHLVSLANAYYKAGGQGLCQ